MSIGCSGDVLTLECTSRHLYQLATLAQLVATEAVVHVIAFREVYLEDTVGPLTELHATCINSITDRNYHLKVEKRNLSGYSSVPFNLNSCNFVQVDSRHQHLTLFSYTSKKY